MRNPKDSSKPSSQQPRSTGTVKDWINAIKKFIVMVKEKNLSLNECHRKIGNMMVHLLHRYPDEPLLPELAEGPEDPFDTNFLKVLACCIEGAQIGHPTTTFYTAKCYEYEIGVVKDLSRAINLYISAAEKGVPAALKSLLQMAEQIIELMYMADPDHPFQAARLYALNALGRLYEVGNGLLGVQDHKRAVEHFLIAASAGDPAGEWNLARCLEAGTGVKEPNKNLAMSFYKSAAEKKHAGALNDRAYFYEFDEVKDLKKAQTLYEAAIAEESQVKAYRERALGNLSGLYAEKKVEVKDSRPVHQMFKDFGSCRTNSNQQRCALSLLEQKENKPENLRKALYLMTIAADQNDVCQPSILAKLGTWYQEGKYVVQDLKKAVALHTKSAQMGNRGALVEVYGYYLIHGGNAELAVELKADVMNEFPPKPDPAKDDQSIVLSIPEPVPYSALVPTMDLKLLAFHLRHTFQFRALIDRYSGDIRYYPLPAIFPLIQNPFHSHSNDSEYFNYCVSDLLAFFRRPPADFNEFRKIIKKYAPAEVNHVFKQAYENLKAQNRGPSGEPLHKKPKRNSGASASFSFSPSVSSVGSDSQAASLLPIAKP